LSLYVIETELLKECMSRSYEVEVLGVTDRHDVYVWLDARHR
jgi:hypothetical protein